MKLHRHIIRAVAMLDAMERDYTPHLKHDGFRESDPEFMDEWRETIATIRGDLRHVDRKLSAFQQIIDDVLNAE